VLPALVLAATFLFAAKAAKSAKHARIFFSAGRALLASVDPSALLVKHGVLITRSWFVSAACAKRAV